MQIQNFQEPLESIEILDNLSDIVLHYKEKTSNELTENIMEQLKLMASNGIFRLCILIKYPSAYRIQNFELFYKKQIKTYILSKKECEIYHQYPKFYKDHLIHYFKNKNIKIKYIEKGIYINKTKRRLEKYIQESVGDLFIFKFDKEYQNVTCNVM